MAPSGSFSASYAATCHAWQILTSCWTVSHILFRSFNIRAGTSQWHSHLPAVGTPWIHALSGDQLSRKREVIWKKEKSRSYTGRQKRSERNRHTSLSWPATQKSFLLPDAGSRSRSSLSALEYRDKIELEAKMKITTINALKTFTANQSVQGGRDEEESQSDIQEWLSLTQRAFWCWGLPVEGCFTWGSKRAGLSNLWGFFHLTDKALCCWYCMDIHTPGCCVHFTHWKRIQAQSLSHVTQPFCLLFGRAEFPSSHTLRLLQGMITVVVSRSKGNSWGWGGVGSGQGRHLKREAIISSLVSAFLPVMKTGPTDLMWFCVPWVLKD